MTPAVVIARASLAEHTRRRLVFFFIIASVLLTTPLVYLVRNRQLGQLAETPRGLVALASLGFLQFLALIATLAASMGNIGRPFASGEAITILARPVARWQYALGRLLGSAAASVGFCFVLAVETTVVQLAAGSNLTGVLWAHWATVAFNMVVVVVIATVVSALASNAVLVAVTTFFAYQALRAIAAVHPLVGSGRVPASIARWVEIAWIATPKLLPTPLASLVTEGRQGAPALLASSPDLAGAAVAWVVGLAALAMWLTSRKDI
jgi:ABC-type transport system involved in multi-copper enzyme maturation permease subunit